MTWIRMLQRCQEFKPRRPGGGVLLGIFGGGVPPASPNPDPISDQKYHFPHPFSDLASKIHTRFQT